MLLQSCALLPRVCRSLLLSQARKMSGSPSQEAARKTSGSCVFCSIVSKEAPANILREEERFLVFPDISPAAEHHLLVIPKVITVALALLRVMSLMVVSLILASLMVFLLTSLILMSSMSLLVVVSQEHIVEVRSLGAQDVQMVRDMEQVLVYNCLLYIFIVFFFCFFFVCLF